MVLRQNCTTCCAMSLGIRALNANAEKSSNACRGDMTRGLPAVLAYWIVPLFPVLMRLYSSMPHAGPIGLIDLGKALPVDQGFRSP